MSAPFLVRALQVACIQKAPILFKASPPSLSFARLLLLVTQGHSCIYSNSLLKDTLLSRGTISSFVGSAMIFRTSLTLIKDCQERVDEMEIAAS